MFVYLDIHIYLLSSILTCLEHLSLINIPSVSSDLWLRNLILRKKPPTFFYDKKLRIINLQNRHIIHVVWFSFVSDNSGLIVTNVYACHCLHNVDDTQDITTLKIQFFITCLFFLLLF